MSALSWPLQQALYQHLSGDADLAALLGAPPRIYDAPPPSAAMPYVVLGESRASPLAGADGAFEHDLRLRIVSRHEGRREVRRVIDALCEALHEAQFPVEGASLIDCRFVFADVFRRESEVHHGVARFRIVIAGQVQE